MKTATGKTFCFGNLGKYIGDLLTKTIRPRIGPETNDIMTSGIRFDIYSGYIVRPIAKFYHWKLWKAIFTGDKYMKAMFNPWNSGNHWFVIRSKKPHRVLFFSFSFIFFKWNPGGYLGFRTALVDSYTHQKAVWCQDKDGPKEGEVESWATDSDGNNIYAWGDESENGNIYAEPTACLRLDMRN